MSQHHRPVYLLSTPRSGSNLVRSILGGHPEISAPAPFETALIDGLPDLDPARRRKFVRDVLIWQKYSAHGLYEDVDPAAVADRLDEWTFYDLQRALYDEYADEQHSSLWVSKYNGGRFDHVNGALDFYDDLKILYLVRDARDVALSCKTSMPGPFHPYLTAKTWKYEQVFGKKLLAHPRADVHRIKYEDVLQDPDSEIRDACEFLGVEAVDQMLSYHERNDTNDMAENAHMFENLSKPIMADNYGKFHDQLPDDEVAIIENVAGDELDHFGYDLVNDDEKLANLELRDETAYQEREEELSSNFERQMWREDTLEMLKLRLGQRFKYFTWLRYY